MSRWKKDPKTETPLWAKIGHQKPITRRDFLATGIIPFSAWVVGPTLATVLSREAYAQGLCDSMGPSMIPFITINLQGGASLASQLALRTVNGDFLPSYSLVGLGNGPGQSFDVVKSFNGADFAGALRTNNQPVANSLVSNFLGGVQRPNGPANQTTQAQADAAALAISSTTLVSLPVQLNDDTGANPIDVTGLVLKMGMQGSKLPNLGTQNSSTGINQRPAGPPPPAPFIVSRVSDLASSLGYSGAFANMSKDQHARIARTVAGLSSSQLQRFSQVSGGESTLQLLNCVGIRNSGLIASGGGDVNPFANGPLETQGRMREIWSNNNNGASTAPTDGQMVQGALVYNSLTGNAATVNINLGGYDYHDGTRGTGDGRDRIAGELVGKILRTAKFLNKKCFIYVCSDGSTSSAPTPDATSVWTSDRGSSGVMYMIAFDPSGKAPETSGNQVGGFTAGQVADASFPTGGNPQVAAEAVFANYANWNGMRSFLSANRVAVDDGIREKVIKLQKG